MFNNSIPKQMAKQFVESLPPSMQAINKELESYMHDFMQKTLSNMSLVTKEEFDIQCQVLAKTRAKVDELEKVVAKLEQIK